MTDDWIVPIDSLEDYFADMHRFEAQAMKDILPKQLEVGWGSYCIRYEQMFEVWICTQVYSIEKIYLTERGAGSQPGETESTLRSLRDAHLRGYRYGKHYSVITPDGELGSVHVVKVWPISEEDFLATKENGWNPPPPLVARLQQEFLEAATASRTEQNRGNDGPDEG